MRAEAINALADWASPPKTDRVIGLFRPVSARDAKAAADALRPTVAEQLLTAPDAARIALMKAVTKLGIAEAAPQLHQLVADRALAAEVRVAALDALSSLKDAGLAAATRVLREDPNEQVRIQATRLLAKLNPKEALPLLLAKLRRGTVAERQDALTLLPGVEGKPAPPPRVLIDHPLYRLGRPAGGSETDRIVTDWLDQLLRGKLDKALNLELLDVANGRQSNPAIKSRLEKYRESLPKNDALANWREAFHGGDAAAGKRIFFERIDVACQRCHKIEGQGGEGGPDLTGIGSRATREYLMESIVFPNKQIARGYENAVVVMNDGRNFAGVVQSEDDSELTLNSPEDGVLKLRKNEIKSRDRTMSGMPEEFSIVLNRQELRNLVEYLAGLKQVTAAR
jgi:quinoprotein glucose dehydrogenase